MQWAVRQASPREDAMATVARAELYAEFVLGVPKRIIFGPKVHEGAIDHIK